MALSSKVIKARNVRLATTEISVQTRLQYLGGGRGSDFSSGEAAAFPDHNARKSVDEQAACKQAHEQGFTAGVALQKEEIVTTMKALSKILREVGDFREKLFADAEEQMLGLVLAVAKRVIYDEVSTNNQIIVNVLREAVASVVDREGMKIYLNPQDYLFMVDMKEDFLRQFKGMKNVTFEEDAGIQRGGALLNTVAGEVDARLEQRLKEVNGALNIR